MKDNLSRRRKTLKINHKHSGRLGSMALTGNQSTRRYTLTKHNPGQMAFDSLGRQAVYEKENSDVTPRETVPFS